MRKAIEVPTGERSRHGASERVAGFHAPMWIWPFVRLGWTRLAGRLVFTLGLVAQLVLLWMAGELLDLFISAVELWTELARKHLELTL